MWANERAGLAGPILVSRGKGALPALSAVANAPVAPVSPVAPDPLGLTGTVVKVNIDVREVDPQALACTDEGKHCRLCAVNLP